jgi:hypothetical protein
VNEIENFAVLADPQFNDSFWEANSQAICEAFERTASTTFNALSKKFGDDFWKLHSESRSETATVQAMRRNALSDWKSLMPGKDICKHISNYNAMSKIKDLDDNDIPPELKDYLYEIICHFEKE